MQHPTTDIIDLDKASADCKRLKLWVDKEFEFLARQINEYKPGPDFIPVIYSQAEDFIDQILASQTMTADEKTYMLDRVQKFVKDLKQFRARSQ